MKNGKILGLLGIIVSSVLGTLIEQRMMRREVEEAVEKHFENENENEEAENQEN